MTAPEVMYGSGLEAQFFGFVHGVCDQERGASLRAHTETHWTAPQEIFAGYLALDPVILKSDTIPVRDFQVEEFVLTVDEGDMIAVTKNSLTDDDGFAEYMLRRAQHLFRHDHTRCIQAFVIPESAKLPRIRGIDGSTIIA